MLNYTTTTIVNSADSIQLVKDASNNNKAFRVKFGPEFKITDPVSAVLVGKKVYTAAKKAKAVIDLKGDKATTPATIYRIALYIRLRNNNNPYFNNAWTFKGKPIYIEYNYNDTAAEVASRAKKYMIAQYGYNLVDIVAGTYTADQAAAYNAGLAGALAVGDTITSTQATDLNTIAGGSSFSADDTLTDAAATTIAAYNATLSGHKTNGDECLIITAHDQWEIFMDQDANEGVNLEKLVIVDTAGNIVEGSSSLPTHEAFVPVVTVGTKTVDVDNGNEAFGDFAHIVKDLRLPTAANRRWQGIAEGDVFGDEPNDDKPMPNGHYTQYTIQYTMDRGVMQQTALAGVATSRTVHVFYVESGATTDFEDALYAANIAAGTSAGGGHFTVTAGTAQKI